LAWGRWDGTAVTLHHTSLGRRQESIAQTIARWLPTDGRALLALDAPLGWPASLGKALADHQAGGPLPDPANTLFRRETDRFIWQQTGKLPLDVGADRIARTAHAALALLQELRHLTGLSIPLAWEPDFAADMAAIEVYPAGTLRALFRPDKDAFLQGR
jgi:predicted RNase H-like nuclease